MYAVICGFAGHHHHIQIPLEEGIRIVDQLHAHLTAELLGGGESTFLNVAWGSAQIAAGHQLNLWPTEERPGIVSGVMPLGETDQPESELFHLPHLLELDDLPSLRRSERGIHQPR